ncbi:MAG: DUF421 domain-containing protein [Bacillaceae bacterium]|nr:DUF421 domain-containing protein [Bacillaceae bacterium]
MEYSTMIFRTFFLYFFILVVVRLMGKREIAKLSVIDLVVSIMIAEIAVLAIEDPSKPLLFELIPIVLLMVIQVVMAWLSLKSVKIRQLLDGTPTVLIANGKINDKEMAKLRYNFDDLLTQLREKDIKNVADVEFAILETSGKLSVFPKEKKTPVTREDLNIESGSESSSSAINVKYPMPVIMDGKVMDNHLEQIGKTRFWLKNQVQRYHVKDFKDISFASVDEQGNVYVDLKDD